MTTKPVISPTQLLFMVVGSALVFPYTFMPIVNTTPANQDVWISFLLSFVYIIILNTPLLYLMNKFRGMNINEVIETITGKLIGKIIAFFFLLFFVYCFTACMMITAEFINTYLFPDTPTWALLVVMIVPVCYASYKGAGVIGRLAVFFEAFVVITIIVFFLFGTKKFDLTSIKPILSDSTFLNLNIGAFLSAVRVSEILIVFVFSFFLDKKSSITKTYFTSLLVFMICFLLILLPTILTLGIEYAKKASNPYYSFTRQVEAFTSFERLQAFSTLAWFPQSLIKLTLYNFMASYTLSGIVKAKSHKYFVIPISIVAFLVCLLPFMDKSSTLQVLRSDSVFPWINFPVIFVLPLILVIVCLLRKKKMNLIIKQKLASVAGS